MRKQVGRVTFATVVVGALCVPAFAQDEKTAEAKTPQAAAAELMPRADNIAKWRTCRKEAAKDRDKRKACTATRLANRKARFAKIDEWKTKWRDYRKGAKKAHKSCRKDKEGKAKAKDAWKTAQKWWRATNKWIRKGGTKPGDWPAAVPECAPAEKKEAK